jgi:hypothetical protein
LTKSFHINIAANSLSERRKRDVIIVSGEESLSSISLLSVGVKEKKAVSDAERKAETHNNTSIQTNATIALVEIVEN